MPIGLSKKCQAIAPSATLAVDAKAKKMKADGIDVIGFAAGEPDFDTPVDIRNAMKEALDEGMTRYTPVAGTLALRKAICEHLRKYDQLNYTTDEIIVSNGAKHSLYTAFQSILDPGDEVIIDRPCWVSYPEMVRMAGGVPVFVQCEEDNGFLPTIQDIERAVSPCTKAFILNAPSNPNGCVWTRERLMALADLAIKYDFYIISDEIYKRLCYDGMSMPSIASFSEEAKAHTITINGVSKAYAMTGFRIGYAAGPKDIIKGMVTYQSQATSAPNSAAQHAAAVALSMPQDCVEDMRRVYEQRRNKLYEMVQQIEGLHCVLPHGAFYMFLNIKSYIGKKWKNREITDSIAFADCLLESQHVALVPGIAFMAEGFVRISYATSMENIIEGMNRFAAFVRELE